MERVRHPCVTTATTYTLVAALVLLLQTGPLCADVGLWFVRSPEPIPVPPGDEVNFECSLNVPAEQVRWRHDGHFLNHPHTGIEGPVGNHSSRTISHLVVKEMDWKQAGDYQCVAWYGASALASVPARLSLAELKPFTEQLQRTYQAFVGNTVTLHLPTPESNPPAVLECHKNKEENAAPLSMSGTLLLSNLTVRDSGNYLCSAYNFITGNRIFNTHNITLDVRPATGKTPLRFLEELQTNYFVQSGGNVTLDCSAVGNPSPKVTWSKYGGVLPPNRAQLIPGGLFLRNVGHGDEGTYVCELNNGVGPTLKHVAMVHLHEPPEIVKEPSNSVAEEGGEVKLECQVKGQPHPEVTWMLNGESLGNGTHVKAHGAKLHISQVEKWHAGIFQCFATNALGSVYGSALLQVSPKQVTANPNGDLTPEQEPGYEELPLGGVNSFLTPVPTAGNRNPGGKKEHTRKGNGRKKDRRKGPKGNAVMIPPTRPNITRLTDSTVMVRWSVPPNNGLPITFFKVQNMEVRGRGNSRRRGSKARWRTNNGDIPSHIRSYEVDGLIPEHVYRFRIAAVYSNHDNKLSLTSGRFHLHRGPTNKKNPLSAPTLTQTDAVSPTSLQIHWHYIPSPSQPVEGFYVYYRTTSSAGDYIKATIEGEKTRSFIITHLEPDTAYDIKLQSFTVGAASDFSAILTHKTLSIPTEQPPAVVPEVINVSTSSSESSSHGQLYIVIGAVLGGLGLLLSLVLVIFLCNRRKNNRQPAEDLDEVTGKFSDPALQLQAVTAFGKSHMNGRLPQNGFLHNSKINITSNPMVDSEEDKNQTTMEMSFLSSQNNNCSAESEAGGSGTSSDGSWEESNPEDNSGPPNTRLPTSAVVPQAKSGPPHNPQVTPTRRVMPVKPILPTNTDVENWRSNPQKSVGENYV